MSSWSGAARSNYVKVADMEALKKALSPFEIKISDHEEGNGTVCFLSEDEYGGWPSMAYVEPEDANEEGKDVEFDPRVQIIPFLKKGEVLILIEAGADKLRYVSGHANAYCGSKCVGVSLSDIYKVAARKFKVSAEKISACEY